MFCSQCGFQVEHNAQFCSQCGQPLQMNHSAAPEVRLSNRLSRIFEGKKIAGVCAGIARYLNIDVTLVRVLMTVFAFYPPGVGLIFYLVCWIVMPRDASFSDYIKTSSAKTAKASS